MDPGPMIFFIADNLTDALLQQGGVPPVLGDFSHAGTCCERRLVHYLTN